MRLPFKDRSAAGRLLADALNRFAGRSDVIVLALPRGGVPVAFEVAETLEVELDLMLVRKLGVPGHEELAMGAIASGGVMVLNDDVLRYRHISEDVINSVATKERRELERREQAYRGDRPQPEVCDRTVVLIDDGLATGATMRAGVSAVRQQAPARVMVAVPVAPQETLIVLRREVDEVICLATPEPFLGVGQWYADFAQTTDQEVRDLLARAWQKKPNPASP